MSLYAITDRNISGLSHAEQVSRLIDGGALRIQLREKTLSTREFFDDAAKAVEIAHRHGVKIVINDRVDLAMAVGADGVHLGQDDLPPRAARDLLGPDALIGFSTHSVEQAIAAIKLPVNYIAIGPVFATTTKENPDAVVGLEGLAAVRSAIGDFPLVAIGGITHENFDSVLQAGADSVAVISAVLRPSDAIASNVRAFLSPK